MCRRLIALILVISSCGWDLVTPGLAGAAVPPAQTAPAAFLTGRIVAVAIPGAAGLSPVGTFHAGGPIHDNPALAAYTEPHRILDPTRLLVVSSSNFGAPLALRDQPAGAVLSLDVSGTEPLTIPPDFATAGGQASALDGKVQLYTAQSFAFVNGVNNPGVATAAWPPVSLPLAISINNAFGRLWFANAPSGTGTESIVDPSGVPLANAPSKLAGGVFAGDTTNRQPQQLAPGGLTSAAIGTALLGKSPDGGGRAVFAVVHADGSLVQAHAELNVDGLAPAETIHSLSSAASDLRGATHAGVVFNWVPNPILYVADPLGNSIVVLNLAPDGPIFRVDEVRHLDGGSLDLPVDIAPVVPEVVSLLFSSNTTLAGGSDLYVANRGNGTITRVRQDGSTVAIRQIELPGVGAVGPGQVNGIAVSPDAQRIWVTLSGHGAGIAEGTVVELPAFES
jgi:hypothetical protein